MNQNKISVVIPDEEFATAIQKLKDLDALLKPFLIALTPDERRQVPKMGDKTFVFVDKAMDYSADKPAFSAGFIDLPEWKKDSKAKGQLTTLLNMCTQLSSNLDDTAMLCGSEAYTSALGFYQSVKQATKMNVPDAKIIYDDLSQRFPGRKGNKPS